MKMKILSRNPVTGGDIQKRVDAMIQACRAAGLKVTQQRIGLLRELLAVGEHLSAEALFERLKSEYPTLSLSTVYNTLQTLARLGEIGVVTQPDGPTLYDPTLESHHHLHCRQCGGVFDVFSDGAPMLDTERMQAGDFEIGDAQVLFRGRCPECVRKGIAAP